MIESLLNPNLKIRPFMLRGLAAAVCLLFMVAVPATAVPDDLLAWWGFEPAEEGRVRDAVSGRDDVLSGNSTVVAGVRGKALRFDGFTTVITRVAADAPVLGEAFTIEAWVAVGAYPWNWCPIAAREREDKAGFFFGIGPAGEVGLKLMTDGGWTECVSTETVPLRKWTHVAASFRKDGDIRVFINGRESERTSVKGSLVPAPEADLLIGRNRDKVIPSHPVRVFGTKPAWFSFDGTMDEIKFHGRELEAVEIARNVAAFRTDAEPEIPARVMPSSPPGPGRFGAYYTKLEYYKEWDALWRVSDHPDIVVQFDGSPIRVVFWRGTRYSPAWVMENGQWMADQSAENFDRIEGCYEHMLDLQCRYSHVRIIENTEGRVVVHWRYIPVSVLGNFSVFDERTGWADTVDEYYYFYPDGLGVRKVIQYTTDKPLHPSELIVLCQPGTRPEDNIHLDALTLANLRGESHTYSWAGETPDFGKEMKPENPVIQVVNLKSQAKPFMIYEPGCRMHVFAHEMRKDVSRFPWWNHWPEAQIPSDGRYCQAPDRPSSFSLAWGGPPQHKGPGLMWWSNWLYGTTERPAGELAVLAKSWAQAPELKVEGGFVSRGYDRSQRAYILEKEKPRSAASLKGEIAASGDSPLVNACLVFKSWSGDKAAVRIDGRPAVENRDFRFGVVRGLDSDDGILWIIRESVRLVKLDVEPAEISR